MGFVERLRDYYKFTFIVIVAQRRKYLEFLNSGRSLPVSVFHYENPEQDFRGRRTRIPRRVKVPLWRLSPSSDPYVVSVDRETLVRRSKAGPAVDESYNISYRSVFSTVLFIYIFFVRPLARVFFSARATTRVSGERRRGDATTGSDSFECVSLGNAKPCRTHV